MLKNKDIRGMLSVNGISQKEVAEKLGLHPNSFNRILREDVDRDRKTQIIRAIQIIKKERSKK